MSSNRGRKPRKTPEFFHEQLNLSFEELGLIRRAALGLLPYVIDPESQFPIHLSPLKSSRNYIFSDKLTKNDSDRIELSHIENGNYDRVTLDSGYRLCRASRRLQLDQKYYWEFHFCPESHPDSHLRVGIATTKADMEAPVAVDQEGYCFRDLGGSYHNGHRNHNASLTETFKIGDIIGIGFVPNEKSISLQLFINGIDKGIFFDNIEKKLKWIPSLSIFKNAVVKANFKRPFAFDPGQDWGAPYDMKNEDMNDCFIDVYQLCHIMKTEISCKTEDKDCYFEAMDKALIPAHLMAI
ncbi:SPRY domain containing protein [Tritrichomonas foetus]|uniref:SPRY domain containing protein n=1 Tax=Tritrichomonas foetus TaxID=1144522 RepID=A0A1J4JBJ6_9EUKA|nr:SPRY domain containing protein [Tritrichomonas foetus]|eukprot:OHS95027.1 SPRY domain containing protein [Tritrichomonas foetus]